MTNTIKENLASKGETRSNSTPVQYLNTVDAYNKWAEIYDTDGNFLQALDTLEMKTLLPSFLDTVSNHFQPHKDEKGAATSAAAKTARAAFKLIDLGCGTGRNTTELLSFAPDYPDMDIVGLDASSGMLDVARENVKRAAKDAGKGKPTNTTISLDIFDILSWPSTSFPASCYQDGNGNSTSSTAANDGPMTGASPGVAGVISTLVLEHIPLTTFFRCVSALLRPGGYLLLTNMHSEMGEISQAGFVDETTGTKFRPEMSYCHRLDDVVGVANDSGLRVLGDLRERVVDENLVDVLGKRARKWVGVNVWFGICFKNKEE